MGGRGGHAAGGQGPSQRQLRVGEELRHVLTGIFMRNECHIAEFDISRVTVSEVRISPDLRNATAFIMPLGGENKDTVLKLLEEYNGIIRKLVSSRMHLKFSPRLHYKIDNSFEVAGRIHTLLHSATVQRDIEVVAPNDRANEDENKL
jgi:ribosome-binding factor A